MKRYAAMWSGGKDSALAVDRALHGCGVVGRRSTEQVEARGAAEGNDFANGEWEQRVEDLRHDRDPPRQPRAGYRGDAHVVQPDGTRERTDEAREDAKQG